MLRLKQKIAAFLAVCMLLQTAPVYAAEQVTMDADVTASAVTEEATAEQDGQLLAAADFYDSFAQLLESKGYQNVLSKDALGNVTLTIPEGKAELLTLLSQQTQTAEGNYANWSIKFESTGTLIMEDAFQGLGDENFPFAGAFTDQTITIQTKQTLFRALSAAAELNGVRIDWKGSANQPILTRKLMADGTDHTLNISLSGTGSFSPFIGTLEGTGTVTVSSLNYTGAQYADIQYQDAVGLICGTMNANASLTVTQLTLPTLVELNGEQDVGGLVGCMKSGAKLTVQQPLGLNVKLNAKKNAGGLAGSMETGTVMGLATGTTVTANVTAGEAAGGLFGVAEMADKTLSNPLSLSATINGTKNSGGVYGICIAKAELAPLEDITVTAVELSGPGNCGGGFGTLDLQDGGTCTLTEDLTSTLTRAANTTAYGGFAGTLKGKARSNALVVDSCTVTTNINVGIDTTYYPKYLGGMVGCQETVTLEGKTSTVLVRDPKTSAAGNCGFGGMTANLGAGALLLADTMTIQTDRYSNNPGGGGVAGSTGKGSIVYLKNRLDLSQCPLSTNNTTGQIVGKQDCSLIYAPGVAISRYTAVDGGMELDDIGNYGELYRIADFLTLNNDYSVTLPTLSTTETAYVLDSPQDYACFALAWQSRGAFPTVSDITTGNWKTLQKATISLGADIDMSNKGIGGLSRDVYTEAQTDDCFRGAFQGNHHTITLDIGGQNSANGAARGDGRIYWHNATGLFAALSGDATVSDLKLTGSIRISNNKLLAKEKEKMKSGSLASLLACDTNNGNPIMGVTTEVGFDAVANSSGYLYLGGLFGMAYGTAATTLTLNGSTALGANISASVSSNGSYCHIGGAVGYLETDNNLDITATGATLGGSIACNGSVTNLYAGGLVGTMNAGTGKHKVKLQDLKVDGFTFSGNASERMGGILGGLWANADVVIGNLVATNTSLTSSGKARLGGLVYRSGGKWTVQQLDLRGLTIQASNATALGLLVCHGGPFKEPVNSVNTNVDGLYLVMEQYWDQYQVPQNISFGNGVFDEFVAYTMYSDRTGNSLGTDITANGAGIISLTTNDGTVHMSSGTQNTYCNRTSVGEGKKTNLYSRYYYNLPKALEECDGGSIDSPQELLIWSVYRYADATLRSHFTFDGVTSGTIGGTVSQPANFDMDRYSYYPIRITNSDMVLQYANVKFHNQAIEEKETANKSTRGTTSSHSQHYTMHCAMFLRFDADLTNTTQVQDRTMTVNGVSFAGTVGVVNGGSGALICDTVAGDHSGGNTSVCTVVLADADNPLKKISLDGLQVVPTTADYRPALINTVGSYAGIKANYITAERSTQAGSSLIGDVGGEGATGVTVEFAGTIQLHGEPTENVFTRATLLNSLRYTNGSATYRFLKSKDYNPDETYVHLATHGKELSTSVEYADRCGRYYDEERIFVSANKNYDSLNDFTSYLPYVANSPATDGTNYPLSRGWHELAVNVRSYALTDGCGTYGHPYQVDANTLREAADYLNNGNAANGWKVRVQLSGDTTYHTDTGTHDVELTYRNGVWMNGEIPTDMDVRAYLQRAYYVVKESIELKDFNGIGSDISWPFAGVIKGKDPGTTVTLSGGTTAFVQYSNGCVIRDLTVSLNQNITVVRQDGGKTQRAPRVFFGGVIGCVLGGDNILENVQVRKNSFGVELTGTRPYLVPVGGYVGVIAGGGVLFRGTYSDLDIKSNITSAGTLYQNPIIGRVLGGYAFYEGTGTGPNNTDTNYTINTISPGSGDLTYTDNTLQVNSAQGLLLLSAIVSSGGGSQKSVAYKQGTARWANYDGVGTASGQEDYQTAKNDAPGRKSCLLRYASNDIPYVCDNNLTIQFTNSFDMNGYGNGYRGLSARCVSNAAFVKNESGYAVNPTAVVLQIKGFDGGAKTVSNIQMDVKEYASDDFYTASLGGIFNIVWTVGQSGGTSNSMFAKDLTLDKCTVKLQYLKQDGVTFEKQADRTIFTNKDGLSAVAVGGFIGSVSDISAASTTKNNNYLLSHLHITGTAEKPSEITGPNSAGGLIGASAMANSMLKTGDPGMLLSNGKDALFGPSFRNCSYSYLTVTAKLAAGGLVGYVYANSFSQTPEFSGFGLAYNNGSFKCFASCTVTDENLTVGANSTICAEAKRGVAGGIFGGAGMRVGMNDPNVNTNTGLNVAASDQMHPIRLDTVTVQTSQKDEELLQSGGSQNGPEGSTHNTAAGGVIGRIGNVNPTYFYDIITNNCNISAGNLISNAYAGGIVAYGYTNTSITIQRCEIQKAEIKGKSSGGFVAYGYSASGFNLNMSDCKLTDSQVNGTTNAGGLVGWGASKYYLHNILIKNTSIVGSKQGRLFGGINGDASTFLLHASGISVFADKETVKLPEKDIGTDNAYNGYIIYGDYAGMDAPVDGYQSPFVTGNPNYRLNAEKLLTGDAVGKMEGDTYVSVAARTWADQKAGATGKKNLAPYSKAKSIVNNGTDPEVTSFFDAQKSGPTNLPVLLVRNSDTQVIEDYLNVITNGGYSEYQKKQNNRNWISVSVYYYNRETDSFQKATTTQLENEPASVYQDLSGNLRIRSSSFDNTRDRFSLVEATFSVAVAGESRTYTVSVPVVVMRELQYDYMVTFSYGTEFQAASFQNLRGHVLESTGNPFTACISYFYNREKGAFTEYDWQGYLDDGGDMMQVDKALIFSAGLPKDSQLVLVDRQNGNMAYQYTIGQDNTQRVILSDFTAVWDRGLDFQSSMAEILGVSAEEDDDGRYVIESFPADATVRLKNDQGGYTYYRPRKTTEPEGTKYYALTVPNLEETTPREDYYLVINVPAQTDPNFYLNGRLTTELNWNMPSRGTQLHRYDNSTDNVGNNDESTYQISAGYQQNLKPLPLTVEWEPINLSENGKVMQVLVEDHITFSNQQAYGDGDKLYLKLSATLQEYKSGSSERTEHQFPVGTTGKVHFYVRDLAGQYYVPNSTGGWNIVTEKTEAASYDWSSQGSNMELLLSKDGTNALDLSGVRQHIKGIQTTGTGKIIVSAKMEVNFGNQTVLNEAIPADKDGTKCWAKLHYVGRISTQATALDYSSARAVAIDNEKYYRSVSYQAVLSMDANKIDQLGINLLELVPSYLTTKNGKKSSKIELTAALNLANLPTMEEILANATEGITFKLSLLRRADDHYDPVSDKDKGKYIVFDREWSWTIPQSEFYANGAVVKNDVFDGAQFTMPLTAYVYTQPTNYANYKIQLEVTFNGSGGSFQVDTYQADAYVVYTYACIKPSFTNPNSQE